MDWTQIIITIIGVIGSTCAIALPIILPVTLSRSNRKTREITSKGNEDINSRIDKVESSVNTLCVRVEESHRITQGLHLLDVIEHRPHCWETIRQMFTEYTRVGGNGHVERVYRKWEEDYGTYYDAGEIPPVLMKGKRTQNKMQTTH